MKVTVVGEALVDLVEDESGTREHAGGGPLNIAVGLARLGCDATLITTLGGDRLGDLVRRYLAEEQVAVVLAGHQDRATSTARATLSPNGDARYAFDVSWHLGVVDPAPSPEILHVGSLGAFLVPGAAAVERTVLEAPTATLVSFDPNIRPALLPDSAGVRAAAERLIGNAGIVKLSDEDAAYLWPGLEADEVLDRVLALGADVAVVTRGGSGAVLASGDRRVVVDVPAVVVHDTIGAGDSFMAGLLYAVHRLLARRSVAHAGRGALGLEDSLGALGGFAATCAAFTVTRAGSNPPRLDELGADVLASLDAAGG